MMGKKGMNKDRAGAHAHSMASQTLLDFRKPVNVRKLRIDEVQNYFSSNSSQAACGRTSVLHKVFT